MEFFVSYPFLLPVVAWFFSQLWKVINLSVKEKRFAWSGFTISGGKSSSHTALMTSLLTVVYLLESFSSLFFAIVFTLTLIVMHDALIHRHERIEVVVGGILGIIVSLLLLMPAL